MNKTKMLLNGYKFGYWPNSEGLDKPGDRRRFVFYAREKNIDFEIASLNKIYDIVYLTMGCNIADWLQYKKKHPLVKLVFEIVDSYVLQKPDLVNRSRGLVRFLKGKESRLYLNYQSAIITMLKTADAVVCSAATQREFILKYNSNVHISLDYFLDDITHYKTDYSAGEKLKLVWEGQSYTVNNLIRIKDVLKKLSNKIELHVITDTDIIFPFKIFNKKTSSILSQIECPQYFYPWKKDTFSKLIAQMDIAIIPIGNHDALHWNKPENKLLLFWQIGIPVLTSNTPAYSKVMQDAGVPGLCASNDEWEKKIEEYIKTTHSQKMILVAKANEYLEENHTKNTILKKWDNIFLSLFLAHTGTN